MNSFLLEIKQEVNSTPASGSLMTRFTTSMGGVLSYLWVYPSSFTVNVSCTQLMEGLVMPGTAYETSSGGPFHRDIDYVSCPMFLSVINSGSLL